MSDQAAPDLRALREFESRKARLAQIEAEVAAELGLRWILQEFRETVAERYAEAFEDADSDISLRAS